jgi:putative methionine-R-sulfoxide reductase with GAF domain
MSGFAHPEDPPKKDLSANLPKEAAEAALRLSSAAAGLEAHQNTALSETELDSALQLLVERAQYITGATGAALALPQAEEMVCRASAGSSAPALGARLQVRSGLTGESIARRQLLRCDNAESDSRVNLEACRALGIASIVVLPLLRRNGEVRGLFELFSDHPYAFEERDLIALERMADLTLTALDLAEQRENIAPGIRKAAEKSVEALETSGVTEAVPVAPKAVERPANIPLSPVVADSGAGQGRVRKRVQIRHHLPPRRQRRRRFPRRSIWRKGVPPADFLSPREERFVSIVRRRTARKNGATGNNRRSRRSP